MGEQSGGNGLWENSREETDCGETVGRKQIVGEQLGGNELWENSREEMDKGRTVGRKRIVDSRALFKLTRLSLIHWF